MTKKSGTLLLLPNLLGEVRHHELFLPPSVDRAVETIDGLIAESETGARRYLSHFKTKVAPHLIPVMLLNHNNEDYDFLLEPLLKGERWGVISDAGLPCIADPGAKLVLEARKKGIVVSAFSGPSSIFLSLMLSGLGEQRFSFLGYLPRKENELKTKIKELEKRSKKEIETEVFIETPQRNLSLLKTLLETLDDATYLSVCFDLTLPTQGVVTETVAVWKKRTPPTIEKKCAIFLFKA